MIRQFHNLFKVIAIDPKYHQTNDTRDNVPEKHQVKTLGILIGLMDNETHEYI